MSRRRMLFSAVALGGLAVATAAHLWFWYAPRPVHAKPRSGGEVTALLASELFPAAVWIARPHQNLGALESLSGEGGSLLESAARLLGLPSASLPEFGPFAVPPASELVVAADETGARFAVHARIYPVLAAFARLGGVLAGNPWLEGGDVFLDGRPAEVSWRGTVWRVRSAGLPEVPEVLFEPPASSLAVVELRQALPPLPAGTYRVLTSDEGFQVALGPEPAPGFRMQGRGFGQVGEALVMIEGRRLVPLEPARALALFGAARGETLELPSAAGFAEPGAERWELPAERLLEIAGRAPREAEVSGWRIAALDSRALEGARSLAPKLVPLTESSTEGRLAWGLWLDLERGRAEVERVAELLEGLPVLGQSEAERWRDLSAVLGPLAGRWDLLTATVAEDPRSFRLWLSPSIDTGGGIP